MTCAGHAQIPYDCEPPQFTDGVSFFRQARVRQRRGGRNVLIVQDTARGKFTHAIMGARAALFDRVIRVPYVHFRAVWPNFRLDKTRDFSPRQLRRLFEVEKIEFEDTVGRCGGGDFDLDAHWRHTLETFEWYHPGHPNGSVFDRIFRAFLLPYLNGLGLDLADLGSEMAASEGLPLSVSHPIEEANGDALGVAWHRLPSYLAWRELRGATAPEHLQHYLDMAPQVAQELGVGALASYLGDLGNRYKVIRQPETAALLAKHAALIVPGPRSSLLRALTLASRIGSWSQVAEVLDAHAAYMHEGTGSEIPIRAWLKVNRHPREAADAVNALTEEFPHTRWLRAVVEERLSAG